ncbi:MAG: chemotaxis protein CheW [Spirochaetes bacterium]|jgi:purine-binding chemotaxis protein CheW|nr:chemotaxis protein CheW [Spirochaetota bacterium]
MEISELEKKQEDVNLQMNKIGDGTIKTDDGEEVSEGQIVQLVSFMLEDVDYGVDILSVHEILRIPQITRLPNCPFFIKGVINLRGNVIPVVDVRVRFGFPAAKMTEMSRIIVIESETKQIGLLVDNVSSVIRIKDSNVDPPTVFIDGVSEEFIAGVGRLKDRLVVILNLHNVLYTDQEIEEKKSLQVLTADQKKS